MYYIVNIRKKSRREIHVFQYFPTLKYLHPTPEWLIFIRKNHAIDRMSHTFKLIAMKSAGSFFGGLLAGAAIGAALALLYAPQSGEETRKALKKKISELEGELESLGSTLREKGVEIKDEVKKNIDDIEKKIAKLRAEYTKH